MQITDSSTIQEIIDYIHSSPDRRGELHRAITIIDNNDDAGYVHTRLALTQLIAEHRAQPMHDAVLYFVVFILSTGYPKLGYFSYYRYRDELDDLGINRDQFSRVINRNTQEIHDIPLDKLELLPARVRTREVRKRNSEQKKAELKNISLNAFSFKIFQNSLTKSGKLITIKDGLEYLSKLTIAWNEIRQQYPQVENIPEETADIYFRWVGFVYSKIRKPNDIVEKAIMMCQNNSALSHHWHHLPTVYLLDAVNEKTLESLINHSRVVFAANRVTHIWRTMFAADFSNISNLLNFYARYDSVFMSDKNAFLGKLSPVLFYSVARPSAWYYVWSYLKQHNKTLEKSVWFNNILDELKKLCESPDISDTDLKYLKKNSAELRAQEQFIKFVLDTHIGRENHAEESSN